MSPEQTISPTATSPRSATLADARRLSYAEFGDPTGTPVLFHTGTAFSRLIPGNLTVPEGIRLISIDRAGIGESTDVKHRTFAQSAADTNGLADSLGIATYAVFGWSSGASHAMACAAHHPKRVRSLGLVGPVVPPSSKGVLKGMDSNWVMINRAGNAGNKMKILAPVVRSQIRKTMENPKKLAKLLSVSPPDAEMVGKHQATIMASYNEAVKSGAQGVVQDTLTLFQQPWDFEPSAIRTETIVWHGDRDNICPHGADYVLANIRGSRQVIFAGEGHLALLGHWADVLRAMVA